jgi:two-component system sensor histidine kinase DesK
MTDAVGMRDAAPDGGRFAFSWPLLPMIFLTNLIAPLTEALHARSTPLRLSALLAGLAFFLAVYLWASWHNDVSRVAYPTPQQQASTSERWRWVPIAALVGLSAAFILGDGPHWLAMLIFTSACAGGRFTPGRAVRAVAALAFLAGLLGWFSHDTLSDVGATMFWTGMAGVLTIIINHFRLTNRALHSAREENARLAVEAERLRFARDLHDLLGHDLAHLALKSEVAEYLVLTSPEQAIMAIREIGDVARTALQEVRAAVAGYRQPTLAGELRGAREILSAAGIAFSHEGEDVSPPSPVEATLAWAVREGVTNVVKHSRARHCTIRTTQDIGCVGVEVIDDGRGSGDGVAAPLASAPGCSGNGLPGLIERAAALGGRCDAGRLPDGGFRLSVTLPVAPKPGARDAVIDRVATQTGMGGRP